MRIATSRSPVRQILAGLLLGALCAPAPVWADDASESAEDAEETEDEAPPPVESHWYTPVVHNFDIAADLLLIRPCAGVTAAVGVALFVPAAIMTSPNGKESIKDAYQRFVREPGEYFATRPLGEF